MIIREFQKSDLEQCLALNKIQHKESNLNYHYLDLKKLRISYLNAIDNPNLKVFVLEDGGKIVGCCAVALKQFLFNYATFVQDYFYYVYPEYRRGRTSLLLFNAVKEYAIKRGAIEIHFNYAHGDKNDKINKFLSRLGYNKCSENYRKWIL